MKNIRVEGNSLFLKNDRKIGVYSVSENKCYVNARFFNRAKETIKEHFNCSFIVLVQEKW